MEIRPFIVPKDVEDIANANCASPADATIVDTICTPGLTLGKSDFEWLALDVQGKCIGAIALSYELFTIHIEWIYIIPDYRNQAYGSYTLECIKERAELRGSYFVTAKPFTAESEEFFLHRGFTHGIMNDKLYLKLK